jgi:hypothetical protein
LQGIQDLRNDFSIVSGSSHPGVSGGHSAEGSIFSACPNSRGATSRNTISLDQHMAKHLGHETRFPSLVLNTNSQSSPSYTENGSMIPAENSAMRLFTRLFVNDTPAEQERQAELIRRGRSVMDVVGAEAKSLMREVGSGDRDKLDAWFTSVRELEQRLAANEAWTHKPKPKVALKAAARRSRATTKWPWSASFSTSSTWRWPPTARASSRCMSPATTCRASKASMKATTPQPSRHGRGKAGAARLVEQGVVNEWGAFLRKLKTDKLLDDTMVLLTSNLGNASSHDNKNMPVLFAGGGFKHGQHLAFDQKNNYPLPNLYLSTLHRLGMQDEQFATSTGEMNGLESV